MKKIVLLISILLLCHKLFAQVDIPDTDTTTSPYKNLQTKKFYNASLSSDSKNGKSIYRINDKIVDKRTYDKYDSKWKNMETCKPCILATYDMNDKLIQKAIMDQDCPVGFWIEYYPNGKVKVIGHYKEIKDGNWNNIFERGYCRQDGAWTYYNDRGEKLYAEYWKDGEFVKQVPEQNKLEIWTVELTLNGAKADKLTLTPEQVNQLLITPKFKNSNSTAANITLKCKVSAVGHKEMEQTFTLDTFKNINVRKMTSDVGITSKDDASFTLEVYNNGLKIYWYWLKLKL